MGREVRRVAEGWEHPRDCRGRLVPLFGETVEAARARWEIARRHFEEGLGKVYDRLEPLPESAAGVTFEEWYGSEPQPEDYMPAEAFGAWFQMYENTSEGTPISPVFRSPEELARWLVDNGASALGTTGRASYRAWLRVCRGGYAPTMVLDSSGIRSGVEL